MKRIAGRRKRYVGVIASVDRRGHCRPLWVVWDAATRYAVREVLDEREAASRKVEGAGTRYTVRIGINVTYLFCEKGRWFVEEKECELP